jgi:hypothetical protein
MRAHVILLAAACSMAPTLCAQQPAVQEVNLKATAKVEVHMSHRAGLLGQATCDGAGNVYVRQLDVETSRNPRGPSQLPILEVTSAGTLTGNFRVTDAFAGEVFGTGAYVNREGGVYQAAIVGDDVYVIQFAQDGSVKAKKKLEVGSRHFTSLSLLAVFNSGESLLVGESGKTGHIPFTAVFAADGRLVKEIYEPEDEEARKKAEIGDTQYVGAVGSVGNRFVSMGDIAVGSDGNAYLLHGTSPTLIYVISPAGTVVRKLRITVDDPDLEAASVKAYGGRLAIGFVQSSNAGISIKLIDLKGNPIANYRMDAVGMYSLALACYGADGLTLIPYFAETKLYLMKAKLP